ncbi:MAG TPA: hypothetical protein VM936_03130 [Pyrinomonadaceae bacterium]|nr:hypothetical protein [Pyrinomonadaceae bacterium]
MTVPARDESRGGGEGATDQEPDGRRRRPDGWTFVPLYAALVIIFTYIFVYAAFVSCEKWAGAGCQEVSVRRLIRETGLQCPDPPPPGEPHAAQQTADAAPVAEKSAEGPPAPAPTPVVTIKTEGGGPTPQLSVQVTFPTAAVAPAPAQPKKGPPPEAAYASRLLWALLYAVALLAALVSLLVCGHVVWRSLENDFGEAGRVGALALVAAAGLAGLLLLGGLAKGNLPVMEPLMECVAKADVKSAQGAVRIGHLVGIFLALVLLLSGCATLWPTGKRAVEAVGVIAERMRLLRMLLYAGMVALVVAVLRLDATFNWAMSPLPKDDAHVKLIESITASSLSAEAATYTLLLAAIYVPATLVLRRRARNLITKERGYTHAMGDEWLEKHGLNVEGSLKTVWPKLAAILAPLAVGSASELFKGLGAL